MSTYATNVATEQSLNLRINDVCKRCCVKHKSTIYHWIAACGFPKPRRIGLGRVVIWSTAEVDQWLESQQRTSAGDTFGKSGLSRSESGKQRVEQGRQHKAAALAHSVRLVGGGA